MFFFSSAIDTRTPSAVQLDTTTLKYQLEIHTSAFGSLAAAMEEDTNQTSQQSRKWRIFHI